MKTGDLVFVRGTGIISDVIRYFDKGEFSHVAIAVSELKIIEAQYNKKVNVIPMTYTDYEIVPLNLDELQLATLKEFVEKFEGEYYDYVGLLRIWIRLVFKYKGLDKFNTSKEVICSELAADYLEAIHKAPRGIETLAPNELFKFAKENLS